MNIYRASARAVFGSRTRTYAAPLVALLLFAVPFVAPAQASPCGESVAQLRAEARQSAGNPAVGPSAPQSIGAQLGHQPTPSSVLRAEQSAQSSFAVLLAHAEALDAEGRHAECMQAVASARRVLALD